MTSAPAERPSGEITQLLPGDAAPSIAPLALAAAPAIALAAVHRRAAVPSAGTAADALRAEEIARTRLFIRLGWLLSAAAAASVLVIDAPRAIAGLFVVGLAIGVIVSVALHRAFADPARYTERALMTLAAICVINGHLAVLLYGAFTASPLMIVIGIHFIARTEAERVARWIFATAVVSYAAIAGAIVSGAVADPGVFASDRAVGRPALVIAAGFVLATFWLAYDMARQLRRASLAAIDDLQRATKIASQREALMTELRGDLERALRAGPGRLTDHVVGRFRLGALIGRGAMGEVHDAVELATGAPAAVKLLRREHLASPDQRARFARELMATRAVVSPHVVRVIDGEMGEAQPFIALERLHGRTLAELLRTSPRLAHAELRALARQIGAALDTAATADVVHRDVKPQNIFCTDDGTWKLIDFGVAHFIGQESSPAGIIGTPHYMAPEQAEGRPGDPRADLHALGAILYRCLTGRQPFDAADPAALLYAVAHRMPPRPSALADLHTDLDRWCAIALAKSPDARFPTGAALAAAFADALAGRLARGVRLRGDGAIAARPWEMV